MCGGWASPCYKRGRIAPLQKPVSARNRKQYIYTAVPSMCDRFILAGKSRLCCCIFEPICPLCRYVVYLIYPCRIFPALSANGALPKIKRPKSVRHAPSTVARLILIPFPTCCYKVYSNHSVSKVCLLCALPTLEV